MSVNPRYSSVEMSVLPRISPVDMSVRVRFIYTYSHIYTLVLFQNTALVLTVVTSCVLLTLAAPPKSNDEKNDEGKVGMRFFPGGSYPGFYPGLYPGGFSDRFSGGFPGGFPGTHPGFYPPSMGLGYPSFGYPPVPYPAARYPGPFLFYSNENGNNPTGSNTAPKGKQR
jgi:hypothetical protein